MWYFITACVCGFIGLILGISLVASECEGCQDSFNDQINYWRKKVMEKTHEYPL